MNMYQVTVFANGNNTITIEQDIDPNLSVPDVQRIQIDPSQIDIICEWLQSLKTEIAYDDA